jgi:hypothetical protein
MTMDHWSEILRQNITSCKHTWKNEGQSACLMGKTTKLWPLSLANCDCLPEFQGIPFLFGVLFYNVIHISRPFSHSNPYGLTQQSLIGVASSFIGSLKKIHFFRRISPANLRCCSGIFGPTFEKTRRWLTGRQKKEGFLRGGIPKSP